MPEKVIAKPPEWFCFDDDNNLKFRTKENYYGEVVPDKKFLLAQNNPSYNNPYGERTLSRVFWNVTFKKGGLKFLGSIHRKIWNASLNRETSKRLNKRGNKLSCGYA